jgi:REP element-mobilizing transposase RayT
MSESRKSYPGGLFFVTMTVLGWVDIFTRRIYSDIIIESLEFSQKNKGIEIFAYVIMTNHLHLIVSREHGIIGDWVRDFKSFTSKKITKIIFNEIQESRKDWIKMVFKYHTKIIDGEKGMSFWQNGYFPIDLTSNYLIDQKINYIHENPVRAGFVSNPEDWRLSSASPESPIKVLDL